MVCGQIKPKNDNPTTNYIKIPEAKRIHSKVFKDFLNFFQFWKP